MCVVAVAFCLVGIESAEACDDSYWLVDCYQDYYGSFWVCWWDCYDCCFRWDCLEDSGPSGATQSTYTYWDLSLSIGSTDLAGRVATAFDVDYISPVLK